MKKLVAVIILAICAGCATTAPSQSTGKKNNKKAENSYRGDKHSIGIFSVFGDLPHWR